MRKVWNRIYEDPHTKALVLYFFVCSLNTYIMYVTRYPKFSILYNKFREARKIQKLDFVQLNKPSFFAFFAHILRILLFVLRVFCAFYARVLFTTNLLSPSSYIWFTKYGGYCTCIHGIVYADHTYVL